MLKDASFEDVETGTILTMLDQEYLTISSELELFQALTRLAAKQNSNSSGANAKVPRLDGIGNIVLYYLLHTYIQICIYKVSKFLLLKIYLV